jgi:hypothetical protein
LIGLTAEDLEQDNHAPPGKYHIVITDAVRDEKSEKPCLRLKYKILAGTDATAVGMVLEERLYFTENAKKRNRIFAKRLGLIDDGAYGTKSMLSWAPVVGVQAVVEIIEEQYERRDGGRGISSKINFAGIWSTDDERCKDVPRGKVLETPKVTPKAKAQPKPAADDFSDL